MGVTLQENESHPSYPALNKALLFFGCPRWMFFLGVALAWFCLWRSGASRWGDFLAVGIGVTFWAAGSALHAYDPKFMEVARISLTLKSRYDAGKRRGK